MQLPAYTFGIGDRFGHQGEAQLRAFLAARAQGIPVYPVWNKSNREHSLIGSDPGDVRAEALHAVKSLGWKDAFFVDADHINRQTVDRFIDASDFFTIDVAEQVGKPCPPPVAGKFLDFVGPHLGLVSVPGLSVPLDLTRELVSATAGKFLFAMQTAGGIHRYIEGQKGRDRFVTEISVDETGQPQTPAELFLILAMIAMEKIPVQTIAPKFTGRLNKGVDYEGDLAQFAREFDEDLFIVAQARREFDLPANLKLSVHSGSDKFSLYPIIRKLLRKHGAGIHVKTAGTTWLEELIGLAEAGGDGLAIAREIYASARAHEDELTAPYASVLQIDPRRLPPADEVAHWNPERFVRALRHDPACPDYNPDLRQLLHVSFKLAAGMGARFTDALKAHQSIIGKNVTENLWQRHLLPLFGPAKDASS